MPFLKMNLASDTDERLRESARAELRPVALQAEKILRQALGLPFPIRRERPSLDELGDGEEESPRETIGVTSAAGVISGT